MPDDCFCMKFRVALIFSFYLTVFEYIYIYIYAIYIKHSGLVTDHHCIQHTPINTRIHL